MTFWRSIYQPKFLSVVLGLLSSSLLALGEGENPGKTLTPPANEKNVTSAMALQTTLNQSLSVQNLSGMSRLLAPSKIQIADLSQEAKDAKSLFDQLQSQGKVLSTLTNSALQSLPVAVPIDNTSQGYLMIKKATFYPDHVELDVYARLLLGEEEFYFGATKVNYVMASGIAGTVGLVMLGTQEFSNTQYKVSLTGGSMNTTPSTNASQLKINCGSFAGLVLKGSLELNKDTFLKLDNKGYPMPDGTAAVVSSPIDYQATVLTGLIVPIKNPLAFTLKKSQTVMGFLLANVSFDFSEKATPLAITSVVSSFYGTNRDVINQWTGLFATASTVYVPMYFIPATPKDPTPIRPSFQAGVLLLDDSGLYMNASGASIANFNQLGGSPMTIDQISFTLAKSNYSNFSLSGKIGVLAAKSPFKKNDKTYDFSTLSKDEYLTYAGSLDDKSQSFSLKVKQQDNMYFLGAKSTLRDDSKVDFVEDTPTYRNARITTEGDGTTTSTGGEELNSITSADSPGIQTVNATPNGLKTGNNLLQARLVTPKLSFRYVIGLDVNGKQVNHSATATNSENILSLGQIVVEDLVVGYSFLSKKPIFKFTRMGYERFGNAPVFGKIGLKQLMAFYDDNEKVCTVNFTFYANASPLSKADAFKDPEKTSQLNITIGVDILFAWEVSDTQTSGIDFAANFQGISLSTLQIKSGSNMGFTLDGTLNYENSEEYGRLCTGHIIAEFNIPGLKQFAKTGSTPASKLKEDTPRLTVNWMGGRQYPGTDSAYNFTYFDFLLTFGQGGVVIGPGVEINGFGAGVAVNMTQTSDIGSRYSLSGKKYVPQYGVYGALFALAFNSISKTRTQRGYLGIYAEGAKGTGVGNGFRKLSIFGTWEIMRDEVSAEPLTAQTALEKVTVPAPSSSTPKQVKNLSTDQINNAVKMLDVPLDDKFLLLKMDFTIDASTEDLIIEGNAFGFMHMPLKTDNKGNSNDGNRSYVRGAADSEGAGFLGMISFKIVVDNIIKEDKDKHAAKKGKQPKPDDEPNPVHGYLWVGRPDQPLAIEININFGKEEAPNYLKLGATLFIVGGNVALPSNQVVYTPIVENAKAQINNELLARGEPRINFDLPPSVMEDGTGYFSLGGSLGGELTLTSPTKAVSVYANLRFGFGFMVAYDKNFLSCNDSHWLGSGILHGSGELGLAINLKKTQTKFQILQGTLTAAGVSDFKGNYGAMMFEYSLLGGIIEGRAFMTYGNSPCLSPDSYQLNTKVNLVRRTSPEAEIVRSPTSSEASVTYTKYMLQLHEMIVIDIDPQVPLYEKANIQLDGGPALEGVMLVANYQTEGSRVKRFTPNQNKKDYQLRFVPDSPDVDIDTNPKALPRKWSTLHKANSFVRLVVNLILTDDDDKIYSNDWNAVGDFKQTFTFSARTYDRYSDAAPEKVYGSGRLGDDFDKLEYWYYIRDK